MKATWTAAKTWFANHKPTYKTLQTSHPDEYHIALITFTMDGFYDTFNQACRSIKNEKEAAVFRYRHYYKLLLYCIVHVRGNPPQVSKDLVVYRGCSASFPTVKVGSTFTFRQFTSTSTNKEVATGFSSGGTLFVIHDIMKAGLVTGKAMGINSAPNIIGCNHHSLFDEDEFLMWSLEEFEVIHIVKTGENTEIHLRA
ncbi:T-cell ecto-ADP-ribosyltransferase 2 [Folsomia candida]|nr:T-cell ecto-ADP-ribosyltransferase 2 [Folsomia candida]